MAATRAIASLAPVLLMACASLHEREDPNQWFDNGDDYDVEETVEFTETKYDFTGDTRIASVPVSGELVETWFSEDDAPPTEQCNDWMTVNTLPVEVEGIVTMHPRYYYKTSGCVPEEDNRDIDSDEKYYGSYFIEDSSGGIFVLGDSKVAHFDIGDRVKLKIRATKSWFDLPMVAVHDVLEIDRGPYPLYYEERTDVLTADDAGKVRRMTGTVGLTGDFGEVQLCLGAVDEDDFDDVYAGDDQRDAKIRCISEQRGFYAILDTELQRRGVEFLVGDKVQLTGPVLFSFDAYRIVLTRVGQLEHLE